MATVLNPRMIEGFNRFRFRSSESMQQCFIIESLVSQGIHMHCMLTVPHFHRGEKAQQY